MKQRNIIFIFIFLGSLLLLSNNVFSQSIKCDVNKLKIVKFNERNQAVGELQKCLYVLGFITNDGITNFFGKRTQEALKNFYKSTLGINVDGKNFGFKGLAWFRQNYSKIGEKQIGEFLLRAKSKNEVKEKLFNQQISMFTGLLRGAAMPTSLETTALTSVEPSRFSETNVQVKGIDEPDVVKNDGQQIYLAREYTNYYLPFTTKTDDVLIRSKRGINIIKAFPVEELSFLTNIAQDDYGNSLLLDKENKILIVLNYRGINAYDITSPSKPQKLWSYDYAKNTNFMTARFYNGKLYVFLNSYLAVENPCPLPVLESGKNVVNLVCTDFYIPTKPIANNISYNIFILDPKTGNIDQKTSFLGSFYGSVIYVSPKNIYVTYSYQENINKYALDFFSKELNDILPFEVVSKIMKLKEYEISDESKMYETNLILNQYLIGLDLDNIQKIREKINQRINRFIINNLKEFEKTVIVKVNIDNLEIKTTGYVPGNLLNQFSLDEDNNYLRTAVTLGERGFSFGSFWVNITSSNAVYILDENLNIVGSLENLGLTERVYSARFYGNRGYLVTFRQIDPFYVLDLSDPRNPSLKGELKIPGYSSYLEELEDNLVIGVGQEGFKVKISLFDVSNPGKPLEIDKYLLNEGWSEILNNHRAFLRDNEHQVFFIPSSQKGYIFSYKNKKLDLVKEINNPVKRGIYIDDYFYLISDNSIIVFDENNWQEKKRLEF